MKKPCLRGEKISLRGLGPQDEDAYMLLLADESVGYYTGSDEEFSREDVRKWLNKVKGAADRLDMAILEKKSQSFVGEVVLNEFSDSGTCGNIRIALAGKRCYGQGFGTEAMALLIDWAFANLPLTKIELEVLTYNPRAQHVYRKLGFVSLGLQLGEDGKLSEYIKMRLTKGAREEATSS